MSRSVDFSEIDQNKENIQSIREGRSAFALSKLFSEDNSRERAEARQKFDRQCSQLDELDDPLECFVEYLAWLKESHPQGSTEKVTVLKQCAHQFIEYKQYKNDIRYLKVWLEYCLHTDHVLESFVTLYQNEIGREFALFYEEFAKYLETNKNYQDAEEVYKLGLDSQAKPLVRLERSYKNFIGRMGRLSPTERAGDIVTSHMRQRLEIMRASASGGLDMRPSSRKRAISVLSEASEEESLHEKLHSKRSSSWQVFNTQSNSENSRPATSWAGQTLHVEPTAVRPKSARIEVFKEISFPVKKLVKTPGKKDELVNMNIDMLHHPEEGECCPEEILLMARGQYRQLRKQEPTPTMSKQLSMKPPSSPTITMTMFTKAAIGDVYGMINQPLQSEDSEITSTQEDEGDYITETIIPIKPLQNQPEELEEQPKFLYPTMTPITEVNESSTPSARTVTTPPPPQPPAESTDEPMSSPFIEPAAKSPAPPQTGSVIIDPTNRDLRLSLLHKANPSLDKFPDYHRYNTSMHRLKHLKKYCKKYKHSSHHANSGKQMLELDDLIIDIVGELGEGGYATVFYGETSLGDIYAIKVEDDKPIAWEFYLLKQIQRKFEEDSMSPAVMASVINAKGFYQYQDESYLLLDYEPQGTILDLFNNKSGKIEEQLTVFLVAELLKTIIALHRIGVIHGDMKAENCMIRFQYSEEWEAQYSRYGSRGWEKKGIKLIDFGRSIDTSLLPPVAGFNCNWKDEEMNELDCFEMREHKPWTYQPDMYGIATIAHLLLFGKHLQTTTDRDGMHVVKDFPKRGLKYEHWQSLFSVLLNPLRYSSTLPIPGVLNEQLNLLDTWLEHVTINGDLKSIITRYEEETRRY